MPIRAKLPDGREITVPDDTSPEELDAIVNEMSAEQGGPQSASVMDERGLIDRSVDLLPAAASTVFSLAGAGKRTAPGMALAGLGAAAGEGGRQIIRSLQGRQREVPQSVGGQLRRMGEAGAVGATTEGGGRGLVAGLSRIAKPLMKAGLGAQATVRKNFPTVDLEDVALREGTIRDPFSLKTIGAKSTAAGQAVSASGRAADAAGTAPIQAHEVLDDLLSLRTRFEKARMPELVQAIDDRIATIRKEYGEPARGTPDLAQQINDRIAVLRGEARPTTPGMSIEDALTRKSELQQKAKATIKDPMAGPIGTRAFDAEQSALTRMMHDKDRVPGVGPTLTRAQQLMALEKAGKNLPAGSLRNILGTVAGAGAGAVTGAATGNPLAALAATGGTMAAQRLATSPTSLGRYGIAARRMSGLSGTPAARGMDALTRASLLELLQMSQEQE